jgi:hypothetical protein
MEWEVGEEREMYLREGKVERVPQKTQLYLEGRVSVQLPRSSYFLL